MEYKDKVLEFEKQLRLNCNMEFNKNDGTEEVYSSLAAVQIAFDEYLTACESENKPTSTQVDNDALLGVGEIDHELLEKAISKWGAEAQVEMIEEECIELALAIHKLKRVRGDKHKKYIDVVDEIADVKIMIEQAQKIFDKAMIDARVTFKQHRLKDRLSEGVQ